MDPQTTFDLMIHAWALDHRSKACEHARALVQWLDQGGFAPHVMIQSFDRQHRIEDNKRLVYLLCEEALRLEWRP